VSVLIVENESFIERVRRWWRGLTWTEKGMVLTTITYIASMVGLLIVHFLFEGGEEKGKE